MTFDQFIDGFRQLYIAISNAGPGFWWIVAKIFIASFIGSLLMTTITFWSELKEMFFKKRKVNE